MEHTSPGNVPRKQSELEDFQGAILNILEDNKKDSESVLSSRSALLNILEDLEIANTKLLVEKVKAEKLVQELQKFKLAVDTAFNQIFITDGDANIIYSNKASVHISGYTEAEMLGKKPEELWGGLMSETFYKKLWKTIQHDKESFVGEMENKHKNGKRYRALVNITPIFDGKNDISFYVAIERDITKEKEIDKAKTEFVSLASHQLRTPLSIISWYTEILLSNDKGDITPLHKKYLMEIYTGNRRMIELVNALLNVSRMEMGTFVMDSESTDVTQLVQSVINSYALLSAEKNITLLSSLGVDIPSVQVDPKLLRMVVENLLSNAIKYTPWEGTITFSLSYNRDTGNVLFKVTDTGYGIPKHQREKIFTKLFRADNVRERDTEGTGLGLYIVQAVVEKSGGKIWFESEEDVGSTFYIELPIGGG